MQSLRDKTGLYLRYGRRDLPRQLSAAGVKEFIDWLSANDKKYLFSPTALSGSPLRAANEAQLPWADVPEENFYTLRFSHGEISVPLPAPRLLRLCHRRTGPHQRAYNEGSA